MLDPIDLTNPITNYILSFFNPQCLCWFLIYKKIFYYVFLALRELQQCEEDIYINLFEPSLRQCPVCGLLIFLSSDIFLVRYNQ